MCQLRPARRYSDPSAALSVSPGPWGLDGIALAHLARVAFMSGSAISLMVGGAVALAGALLVGLLLEQRRPRGPTDAVQLAEVDGRFTTGAAAGSAKSSDADEAGPRTGACQVSSEDPDLFAYGHDVVRPDPVDRLIAYPDTAVRDRVRRHEGVAVDHDPAFGEKPRAQQCPERVDIEPIDRREDVVHPCGRDRDRRARLVGVCVAAPSRGVERPRRACRSG